MSYRSFVYELMGMHFPHVSLLRSGIPLYLCAFLTLTLDCWFVVLECRCYICTFELFFLVAHICVFTFVRTMCVCLVYPMCTVSVYPELTSFLSVSLSLTLSLFWTPFPCHSFPPAVWYCGCLHLGVRALCSSMHCILPPHTSIPLQDGGIA